MPFNRRIPRTNSAQVHFEIDWTVWLCKLDKYNLQLEQIYLIISTNVYCNINGYIFKLSEIHFAICTKYFAICWNYQLDLVWCNLTCYTIQELMGLQSATASSTEVHFEFDSIVWLCNFDLKHTLSTWYFSSGASFQVSFYDVQFKSITKSISKLFCSITSPNWHV